VIALAIYLVVKIRNDVLRNPQDDKRREKPSIGSVQRFLRAIARLLMGTIAAGRFLAIPFQPGFESAYQGLLKGILMFTEPEVAQPWELWVRATELHHFIGQNGMWLWPIFQTLHYFGLSLPVGTVGLC